MPRYLPCITILILGSISLVPRLLGGCMRLGNNLLYKFSDVAEEVESGTLCS